ncbi:MAG: isopeptide-forming domain-containing fimbrial protein, partial [Stenotrophomonas sp.]
GSGTDSPSCGTACTTTTPVAAPAVTYSKSVVLPAGKTEVSVGDVLTYTLTTVVSDAQTTDTVVLSDTLGTGLAFTAVTDRASITLRPAATR